MFVLIAGGGRTGTQLATLLLAQNHDIRLVESRPDILARIHRELPTEAIYEGNATDPQILEQAGIERADVVAAVTNNDADNLTLCFMARSRYKVGRTIARVNNP
ncbi:MAG: NAD-binding protein, partial [Anaerolineae bacterium]